MKTRVPPPATANQPGNPEYRVVCISGMEMSEVDRNMEARLMAIKRRARFQ